MFATTTGTRATRGAKSLRERYEANVARERMLVRRRESLERKAERGDRSPENWDAQVRTNDEIAALGAAMIEQWNELQRG